MTFNPSNATLTDKQQPVVANDGLKTPPPPDRVRVLVVDDMTTMRNLMAGILRSLGFNKIQEADCGAVALRKLDAGGIDLLITDWNMPGMTGVELIEHVRRHPRHGQIPILMVSAEAKRPNIAEALGNGVDGFIVKPFTPMLLSEKLAQVLYRKRAVLEKLWAGEPTGAAGPVDPALLALAAAAAAGSEPTAGAVPWRPGSAGSQGAGARKAAPVVKPVSFGASPEPASTPAATPLPTPGATPCATAPLDPAGPAPKKFKLSSI